MFGLQQEIIVQIKKWVSALVDGHCQNLQKSLICQNQQEDLQFYSMTNVGIDTRYSVLQVNIELITPNDVDYWTQIHRIPDCHCEQITVNKETQYILILIKDIFNDKFNRKLEMEKKRKEIKNELEIRVRCRRVSRKQQQNKTCYNLELLREWNYLYPISLYKKEIESIITPGTYRGYISNKVREIIHHKTFEEITIQLFVQKKWQNTSVEVKQTIKLVNLYTMQEGNHETYQKTNISIDSKTNTMELLRNRRYHEIIVPDHDKFVQSFSTKKDVTIEEFNNGNGQTEIPLYSILLIDRTFTKQIIQCKINFGYQHAGVYIGNKEVMDIHLIEDGEKKKVIFGKRSLELFFSNSQTFTILSFPDNLLTEDEIQTNLMRFVNDRDICYRLLTNNCQHFAYGAVIGVRISHEVDNLSTSNQIIAQIIDDNLDTLISLS